MDARIANAVSGLSGAGEGDTPYLELAGFSGPLDLLLTLARTRQIDLAGLPLRELVDQLATALQQTGPSLGERGAWLVMACWLLLLRSRLLLPADVTAQQREAEDAAAELRGRLLDLQRAQALARWLDRRPQLGQDVFARGQPEPLGTFLGAQHQVDVIEFLWAAMGLFGDGDEEPGARSVYRPRWADLYKLGDACDRILRLLASAPDGAPLGRLLLDVPAEGAIVIPAELRRRGAWTSTFLASLHLTKEGEVVIVQEGAFAPIHVCKVPDAAPRCFAWADGLEGLVSD
jgi:segregation and condensation protein A